MARDVMRELPAHIDHICMVLGEPTRIMCLACRVVLVDTESFEVDLEWGEPGDCFERLIDDGEYTDEDAVYKELLLAYTIGRPITSNTGLIEYAKKMGYGRHYGIPHCIWCLQGD